jgi:hypothetical protein
MSPFLAAGAFYPGGRASDPIVTGVWSALHLSLTYFSDKGWLFPQKEIPEGLLGLAVARLSGRKRFL